METAVIIGVLAFLGLVALVLVLTGLRVVQQYERAVVFRLGRVLSEVRRPGLTVIVPFGIDRLIKVNMQIVTMAVPAQEGITRDNVSVRVDAVVYFRVIDPMKAVINVQDYRYAVSQVAQTSLRSAIGKADLDDLLTERDKVNAQLQEIIDQPTEGPWGIKIERVEIKDVALPESMKRSMSRQAEAERERRARVIAADGEYQASRKLAEAAAAMARDPAALQLRLLQTVVDVASEKNSTLVMPFPVELLRFFDRAAAGSAAPQGAPPPAAPPEVPAGGRTAEPAGGEAPDPTGLPAGVDGAPLAVAPPAPAVSTPAGSTPAALAPVVAGGGAAADRSTD